MTESHSGLDLGGFRIEALVRRTRYGKLYRGTQLGLGRTVAIAVPSSALDPTLVDSFVIRHRRLAALQHAHLLPVYAVGHARMGESPDGPERHFAALRWIDGTSLADLIEREDSSPVAGARWLGEIASALACLHAHRVVHDQLRPQVLMVADGSAVLAGVGPLDPTPPPELRRLAWVAPERLGGRAPTPAADVWSLGVVLYRLLGGCHPFADPGDDAEAVRRRILEANPARLSLEAGQAVVEGMLAHDPADRMSAGEVAAALDGLVRELAAAPEAVERSVRRTRMIRGLPSGARRPTNIEATLAGTTVPLPVSVSTEATTTGEAVARFAGMRLLEPLGADGTGELFRAAREDDEVLLVLLPEVADVDALVDAIRTATPPPHPALVTTHEVQVEQGRPYLVVEPLEGELLEQALARDPFSPREALELIRVLARALDEAHQGGALHGAIAPSCVRLDVYGSPRLGGFGVLAALQRAGCPIAEEELPYLAPERRRGAAPSVASDVYGLGALMYALLAGHPPSGGAEAPPHRAGREPVNAHVSAICLRAAAQSPARRHADAGALARDIEAFLAGHAIASATSTGHRGLRPPPRRPTGWIVAALAIVGLLYVLLTRPGVAGPEPDLAARVVTAHRLLGRLDQAQTAAAAKRKARPRAPATLKALRRAEQAALDAFGAIRQVLAARPDDPHTWIELRERLGGKAILRALQHPAGSDRHRAELWAALCWPDDPAAAKAAIAEREKWLGYED